MPPQLVRELTMTAELESGETARLAELQEQHQRLVIVRLPEAPRLRRLRMEIRQTWGGAAPAIYRISVL